MAKFKKSSSSRGRDVSTIARPPGLPLRTISPPRLTDRRVFNPVTPPAAASSAGKRIRLVPAKPAVRGTARSVVRGQSPLLSLQRLTFSRLNAVDVCMRRAARAEVLHAKGIAGKSGLKPKRFSPLSKISCKG